MEVNCISFTISHRIDIVILLNIPMCCHIVFKFFCFKFLILEMN